MKKTKFYLTALALVLLSFCLSGCSSDKPVVSSTASGSGCRIILSAANRELASGGSTVVTAVVTNDDGSPIPDEENAVFFSCAAPYTEFKDGSEACSVKNGVAATIFTYRDESDSDAPAPSDYCTIAASYRSAVAEIRIMLIANSF